MYSLNLLQQNPTIIKKTGFDIYLFFIVFNIIFQNQTPTQPLL